MRYDDYAQKVEKIAKIKRFIAKNVIALLIVGIFVGAVAITLTSIKGTVIDKQDTINTIEYGEEIDYDAKAIFSTVDYEYCLAGTEDWSNVVPREAGTYYVRAIAKSSFGATRYGDAHEFVITSKNINIRVVESEITFGEIPTSTGDTLIPGDHVVCNLYNYGSFSHQTTTVEPILSGVKILDKDDNDVTESYVITTVESNIRFKRKALQITTADATKVYDGTPLTKEEYSITKGGLRDSDSLNITFKSSITTVGNIYNKVDVSVKYSDGSDVSVNYSIDVINGRLSVTKRPIKITSLSKEWYYDDDEHSYSQYKATYYDDTKIDGEEIFVTSYTKATNVVKNATNELFVIIASADKSIDYSDNYDITYEYGTLTINKRPLKIETEKYSWVYDGTAHSNLNYTPKYYLDDDLGHKLVITNNPSITTVGEVNNDISLKVVVLEIGGEREVTDNYDIQYTYGKLSITKRPITIDTPSNSWVYDDSEHYDVDFSITAGGTPETQYVEIVSFPKIINAESIENKIVFSIVAKADSSDVSENYEITLNCGTIEITKRPIAIVTESDEWFYDNTEHYNAGISLVAVTGYPLINNHILKDITVKTKVTLATSLEGVDNKIDFKIKKTTTDGDIDVTANYDYDERITYGKLIVKKRPIIIRSGSASKVYDKTPLTTPSFTTILNILDSTESANAVGDTIYVTMKSVSALIDVLYDEFNNVDSLINDIDTDKTNIVDTYGNKKLDNYSISYEYGTLTVYPRAILVTADSASKIYDNTDLTKQSATFTLDSEYVYPNELTATGSAILTGDDYTLVINSSARYVKRSAGEVVGTENSIASFDISKNYVVRLASGLLTIYPRPIKITAGSAEQVYNNNELSSTEYTVTLDTSITFGSLTPSGDANGLNDVITASTASEAPAITFGKKANKISSCQITETTLEGVVDKASNYQIATVDGTLEITKRKVTITAGSLDKVFDNTYLTKEDGYTIDYTGEAPDTYPAIISVDVLSLTFTGDSTIIYAGSVDNKIYSATLTETTLEGAVDKTENYEFKFVDGILKILKRTISATTPTTAFEYENKDFYDHNIVLADGSKDTLLPDLTTFVTESVTVKYVTEGEVDNALKFSILDNANNNITDSFEIELTIGKLSVTKRAVTLTAKSNSKVYDNTDLVEGGFVASLTSGSSDPAIPTGDSVAVTMKNTSVARLVKRDGEGNIIGIANEIGTYTILEGDDDKSGNYDITLVAGTLIINPREITITADSASKVYDNKSFSVDTFKAVLTDGSDGNANAVNDVITITVTGATLTDVGTSTNEITSVTIKENTTDKTDNYIIHKVDGTLEITKRKITITADSDEKVYDDTALTKGTYKLSFTAISDPDEDKPSGEVMAEGDVLTLSMTSGSTITNKGEGQNKIDIATVKINDATDKLANYEITYVDGKLIVTGKPLTITTPDDSRVYNDEDFSNNAITITGDLVLGHSSELDTVTTLHDVAKQENIVTIKIYKMVESDKVYTTANYDITYVTGTLEVTKRPITISSSSDTWSYDGAVHSNTTPVVTYPTGYPKLANHEVTLTDCTQIYNITTGTTNNFTPVITNTTTSAVVTNNYDITKEYGTLIITNRAITVNIIGETFEYDGTFHSPTTSIASGTLSTGHEIQLVNATTRRDVTTGEGVSITATIKVIDTTNGNADVSSNYVISTGTVGKFIVTKANLSFTFNDVSKVYDGTSLIPDAPVVSGLMENDNFSYTPNYQKLVGSTSCIESDAFTITSSLDSTSVKDNYNITKTIGTITITVREINISAKSYSKYYDGMAIADKYTCVLTSDTTKDGVATGDTLNVVFNDRSALINVGSITTSIKSASFAEHNDCYNIHLDKSSQTLTINKRPITITSGSAKKEWDGTPLSNSVVKITTTADDGFSALVGSDTITVSLDDTQTDIGSRSNTYTDADITFTGNDINNYAITKQQGTLEVTKRYIIVYVNETGAGKANGTILTQSTDYDILTGTFLANHNMVVKKDTSALLGYSATITNTSTSTDVSSYYNVSFLTNDNIVLVFANQEAEVGTLSSSDYQVVYGQDTLNTNGDVISVVKTGTSAYTATITNSESGTDNTSKYLVKVFDNPEYHEEEEDDPEDTKPTLTLRPKDETKVFDGTALLPQSVIGLPSGYTCDVTFSGSQTVVGSSNSSITSITIYDTNGQDVTKNYKINYGTGKLTVKATSITININSKQATYGETLTFASNGYTILAGLPSGYTLNLDISVVGSFTEVGTYDASIFNTAYINGIITYTVTETSTGIDRTSSFSLNFQMSTPSKIVAKKITITATSKTKVYDGTALTSNDVTYNSSSLLAGHSIKTIECDGSITNEGSVMNNITKVVIVDASDNDVTKNYQVTTVSGTLTILPNNA